MFLTKILLCSQQEHRTWSKLAHHIRHLNRCHHKRILYPEYHINGCHCRRIKLMKVTNYVAENYMHISMNWLYIYNMQTLQSYMAQLMQYAPFVTWTDPTIRCTHLLCNISNMKNYINAIQVLDELICGIKSSWLIIAVLIWTITPCLKSTGRMLLSLICLWK